MQFARQLRDPIVRGEITCTIRVWQRPRVKEGGRYKLGTGYVCVERILEIGWDDITPDLAKRSGFSSVPDLLKTAVHGEGRHVYLIDFRFEQN